MQGLGREAQRGEAGEAQASTGSQGALGREETALMSKLHRGRHSWQTSCEERRCMA